MLYKAVKLRLTNDDAKGGRSVETLSILKFIFRSACEFVNRELLMHKQSVPIQLHSDLFVRSADELMLLQTRSSNRVSVTLRAFESADYRPLPLVLFSHQIG